MAHSGWLGWTIRTPGVTTCAPPWPADRPTGAFTILLAHTPDILPAARLAGTDLVLCGHTHGGQVQIPFVGAPITPTYLPVAHASGLWREGSTWVNLSGGLGFLRRLRFGSPPEVVHLTLRRGDPSPPPQSAG